MYIYMCVFGSKIFELLACINLSHVCHHPGSRHAFSHPTHDNKQYLQASGSAPNLSAKELGSKWGVSLRAALLHRYGVTAQDLVDVRFYIFVCVGGRDMFM